MRNSKTFPAEAIKVLFKDPMGFEYYHYVVRQYNFTKVKDVHGRIPTRVIYSMQKHETKQQQKISLSFQNKSLELDKETVSED